MLIFGRSAIANSIAKFPGGEMLHRFYAHIIAGLQLLATRVLRGSFVCLVVELEGARWSSHRKETALS